MVATAEVRAINAVIKSKDKQALYSPSVDDLFTSYGDVWMYVKDYCNEYGDIPDFKVIEDRFEGEIDNVEVPAQTKHYMDELRSQFIENKFNDLLIKAGQKIASGESATAVKVGLQNQLGKLDRFSSTSRDLDILDMTNAERRYDEVRERAIAMGGTPGVPTGIDFIDSHMPLGMQPGDIISIIGYPARGKSALGAALFPAKAMAKGYKPLIFSREMSAEAVQDRIFTIMGSGLFSNSELMLGNVNPDDFRTFSEKYKAISDMGAKIVDGNGVPDMTPNFIRGKIDQYHPDIVTLDYLQLLMDNKMTEDMTGRMRNLSLEIKSLANQTKKPFVVISSATPPDGGKVDGPPNVERSAWSRQLAYDSTVCIAIHRIEGTDIYQVECAKNRYGPLFSGFLKWDMDTGVFIESTNLDDLISNSE